MKKNVLESNPDDLVMSFRTETGVYVRCYGRTSGSLPMTRPWKSWRTKTRRRKPGI